MCGIAGCAGSLAGAADARAQLSSCLTAIGHRGPDGEGIWVQADPPVLLGHRRLAVIDLGPGGAQPMTTDDEQHAITFNGEIYNHASLRAELGRAGDVGRRRSDTEVLLLACRRWGPVETARRARGMFAFAYLDRPAGTLWLVRDRFGEKPLYYSCRDGSLVFASELKALPATAAGRRELDRSALSAFLRRGAVPQPATVYRDVAQVPAGCAVAVRLGSSIGPGDLTHHVYWDAVVEAAAAAAAPFTGSLDEAAEAVHAALRDSVRACTVSDQPVGAFLSGGVDSSLVTALMQECSSEPVRSFTIGFDDSRFDESGHAVAVAAALGTRQTTQVLSAQDVLAVVPDLARMYDEPFGDSSQLPTHLVSRLARRGVTVSLSGDGGDELFGGYNRHITAARTFTPLARVPRAVRSVAGRAALRCPPNAWDRVGRALPMTGPSGGLGGRVHKLAAIADFRDAADLYDRLTSTGSAQLSLGPRPPARGLPDMTGATAQFMLADTTGYLTDDILTKVDRAAMATSLETRVPMLDPLVYRLAWSLPVHHKVQGAVGKVVLRRVLAGLVPDGLLDRPKAGFGIPLGSWLRGPLAGWADDLLDPTRLGQQGLVDAVAVRATWAEHRTGRRNHEAALWNVLMLQSWLDTWHG